jgi:peptidyl-prolyl cis-trans isomerase SurA
MNKFDPELTDYLKGRTFVEGRNTLYNFEGKFYVVYVNKILPVMQKEFIETKGAAISDYQNYLEKTWMEELEKKHTVTFNYDVLYNLNK